MPDKLKFDVSLLMGHEAKHLVNRDGFFALSDYLKPCKDKAREPFTIAIPSRFGQTHILMGGLLKVLLDRWVSFVFIEGDSTAWVEEDLVLLPISKLWGDEEAMLIRLEQILLNTKWFTDRFHEPQALTGFLRCVRNRGFDGLDHRMRRAKREGLSRAKRATKALEWATAAMEDMYADHLTGDLLMHKIRESAQQQADHLFEVPLIAGRLDDFFILDWIAQIEKEDKTDEFWVVTMHTEGEFCVYPAQHIQADGMLRDTEGITNAFKLTSVLTKRNCKVVDDHIVCPDKHTAYVVAQWLCERKKGNKPKLEDMA